MALRASIELSKATRKTADSFPSFFHTVLNALWELHEKHGFRKPKLSVCRDESTVIFEGRGYEISVLHLWPEQVIFVDSRTGSKERYSRSITIPETELSAKLPPFLELHRPTALPRPAEPRKTEG
jgi:hypothetical protein